MKDTDDDIAELLMIPKIGRKKAKALYSAGYLTLDDVSNANLEELAKVPGIGEELASDILSFVSAMVEPSKTPEEKLEDDASLFVCPLCGSMVGADSENCPSCGIAFSDEEEIEKEDKPDSRKEEDTDGYWYSKEDAQLYMCPGCGALIPADAVRCENCGAELGEEETEEEVAPEREMKEGEEDGFWYKEETGLFMCPNCGAFIPEDANSCQTCGVVFEAEEEPEPASEPRELACPNCKSHLEPEMDSCPSCGLHFERDEDDGFWYKDQTSLFICPNCGTFIPETADNCPQCGIVFEGEDVEEAPEPAPEVEKAVEEFEQSLYMCPSCGAFVSGSATKCTVCGTALDEEDVPEEGVYVDDFKLPEIPEKISKEIQAEIEEIELEKLEPPKKDVEESISPETKKGISKDFLSRWEKKEEEEEAPSIVRDFKKRWETVRLTDEEIEKELDLLTLPDKPEEERLAEVDLKLESDLENDELWAEKARILVELERQDEAVACLDKAAELNPAKETEYKRRILDILGVGAEEEPVDLAELISLEEDGEISLEEEAIRKNTEEKIAEIDEKLAENPDDEGLWQEKGELLEKLGRHEEAIKCFDESIKLSYASLQKETEGIVLSLKQPQISVGLTNGQGRVNGWVNGLLIQRGLINGSGKINGMVNGRVNGRGRVNGLVNGLVNGRVNGRGRVNGLINGGLINGRVNGLINGGMINGQGLINGRGRFYRARQLEKARRDWRLRVSWMVVLVGLVLIVPMFANMLTEPTYAISIDGNFSDWNQFTSFQDSTSDQVNDPDLNILETKLVCGRDRVDMFLRVEGTALSGSSSSINNSVDSVFIFMDMDSASDTGYAINNLGAEVMVEIHGWDNNIDSSTAYSFNDTSERNDWNRFVKSGSAPCAVVDSQLEVRVLLPNHLIIEDNEHPKVMAIAMSSVGYSDATDSVMSSLPASLHINTYGIGADILAPGAQDVELLRMRMKGYGAVSSLTAMNFTINGNATFDHLGNIRLANDTDQDGNPDLLTGNLICAINWLDQQNFTVLLSEPLEVPVGAPLTLSLFSDLTVAPYGTTLEMLMTDASATEAITSVNNLERLKHYIGAPSDIQIDGAFGDWSAAVENVDAANDVISLTYNYTTINKNIDLADVRFDLDNSLSVYLSVSGVMLGGSDIPTIKLRPGPSVPTVQDSDRDRVPDVDDPNPLDFDNDDVNDTDENGDLDNDGVLDYDRGGTDWWLNTTIPTDFPVNYSGMNVSIYVGPIGYTEKIGEDYVYVLIDSDDNPGTGGSLCGAIGADHVIVITGKGNEIIASELYQYDSTQIGIPWVFMDNVPSAIDWYRMELALNPGIIGIGPSDDFTVFISINDWKGDYDVCDLPYQLTNPVVSSLSRTGTRSPAGDNVVFNEFAILPNGGEWIELTNPTASSIDISGWTIQTQIRGWRTIYTFPAGSTIGAFGSGSEYIVVSDPFGGPWWLFGNQLRSGRNVRLRDAGNNVIDFTNLGNPSAGQTYARYKNETYGMPTDTDNDANDWYISNGGWIVPEGPTPGGPNERRRPVIQVEKVGNTTIAAPGTQVLYTINYDNIGDGRARHVWINDTIPAGMTFVSSSVVPTSSSGSTYTWYFFNVAPGTNSFTITALVNSTTPIGTVLTNNVNLDYTDQLSNPLPSSSDYWNVTVSGPRPQITVVKTADTGSASPGDQVTYTIYYNNTGTGNAGNVWINDTLPADLIFNSSVPPPNSILGQTQYWQFTNVAPGSYSITMVADVSLTAAPGSTLTNTVTCDYTDQSGSSLPGTSDSFTVIVLSPSAQIVINEVSVNGNTNEWVEVVNPTGSPVDISGWRIRVNFFGGFYFTVYTFPAGTVLGPWGSGSEYFLADTGGGNDFPNGGRNVRLEWNNPGPGWTIIDDTTYPGGIGNTQSWSRFKHEDTGKPIDTDNDANDFYISNDGWIVPEGPTPAAPNDRKRPVMNVEKTATPNQAQPGDTITYTIWYNNTGDGNAKRVWVNDTLPANVDFVSASISPTVQSGQDMGWYFNNVVHDSTNFITVTVRVNANATDGEVLVNVVDLIYHDALRRVMGTSIAWANVTCVRPEITVEKTVDLANANAGGFLNYTIYYNNTGSTNAGNVWVNDTLPNFVTFISSSPAATSSSGLTYYWHFTNVAPGSNSITITVQVNATAPSGTITNWAFLNYTTVSDYLLEESSDFAVTVIPEMQHIGLVIFVMIILTFIGLRRKRYENGKKI